MLLKQKKEGRIFWTQHSKMKMRQYRFSEKRVLKILKKPDRIEEAIVPGMIAQMQITGTKKHPTEAWLMYQIIGQKSKAKIQKLRIISVWRYPGRTPEGQRPIIPEDILEEIWKENIIK